MSCGIYIGATKYVTTGNVACYRDRGTCMSCGIYIGATKYVSACDIACHTQTGTSCGTDVGCGQLCAGLDNNVASTVKCSTDVVNFGAEYGAV